MDLLNNVFNVDDNEINKFNIKYIKVLIITILLIVTLFIIKKDYYYGNDIIISENMMAIVVDKSVLNKVKNKNTILVNEIENKYSINKIIDEGNICYIDITLNTDIENISNSKYKILLGKETIFEYIIRVIKKVL